MPRSQLPARLKVAIWAGQVLHAFPDIRGRDRITAFVRSYVTRFDDEVEATYGPALRLRFRPRSQGRVGILFCRWRAPALAPILDAALRPGDVFCDVGANRGIYTLWGANRVGPTGHVHAFEPHPAAVRELERNLLLNEFRQVRVTQSAVGSVAGDIELWVPDGNSALSSRDHRPSGSSAIRVPCIRLDDFYRDAPRPRLVKIDVEGMELDVVQGAVELLRAPDGPAVVFEADPHARDDRYAQIRSVFRECGYDLFALTTAGLRRDDKTESRAGSFNVLALRDDRDAHREIHRRLAETRFQRSQIV